MYAEGVEDVFTDVAKRLLAQHLEQRKQQQAQQRIKAGGNGYVALYVSH